MFVSDFHFDLPLEQIAQEPPAERGASRMLELSRASGAWRDTWFRELPDLLMPGDVLVLNESRVIPARLFGRRRNGGHAEILLTEQTGDWRWRVLARPARRLGVGETLQFATPAGEVLLEATVTGEGEFGERFLEWAPVDEFLARLDRLGHMPLPPYIRRKDQPIDRDRYQTVFAKQSGSVAAPTAGLHFTQKILDQIRERGVHVCTVTLHVGLGTFQPVRVSRVEEIRLHSERYTLPQATADAVNEALAEGRRVIAAGTTTVRTLEHCAKCASTPGLLEAHTGNTSIFIAPGFEFRVVSALLTNFHLPESTLLMLVSAFAGRERVLAAYRHAVQDGYRFFSYGDCMWVS